MRTLRRVLGLALAGTAGWLAWVLAGSVGAAAAMAVAVIACAVALLLAVRDRLPGRLRPLGMAGVSLLAVAAFLVPANPTIGTPAPAAGDEIAADLWQPFEPARIPGLVATAKGRLGQRHRRLVPHLQG